MKSDGISLHKSLFINWQHYFWNPHEKENSGILSIFLYQKIHRLHEKFPRQGFCFIFRTIATFLCHRQLNEWLSTKHSIPGICHWHFPTFDILLLQFQNHFSYLLLNLQNQKPAIERINCTELFLNAIIQEIKKPALSFSCQAPSLIYHNLSSP